MAKKVIFPKDESKHKTSVEWWYFNGNLKDKKGNKYGYMNCLFKILPENILIPFLKDHNTQELFFAHSIVTDIKNKKSHSITHPIVLISKDSFPKHKLYAKYHGPLTGVDYKNKKAGKSKYLIENDFLNLELTHKGKPLLEQGGFIKLGKATSYYYSLPNFKTKGQLKIGKKKVKVEGKSWMDHQWTNYFSRNSEWSWFSIQLENNVNIMAVIYKEKGKKKAHPLATILYPDGKLVNTKKLKLTPIKKRWTSRKTGAKYPMEWKISIPSEKIELKAKAFNKKQEIIFGTLNYWEGPMQYSGKMNNKKIKGVGFMELVGYPMHKNKILVLEEEIKEQMEETLKIMKKKYPKLKSYI